MGFSGNEARIDEDFVKEGLLTVQAEIFVGFERLQKFETFENIDVRFKEAFLCSHALKSVIWRVLLVDFTVCFGILFWQNWRGIQRVKDIFKSLAIIYPV